MHGNTGTPHTYAAVTSLKGTHFIAPALAFEGLCLGTAADEAMVVRAIIRAKHRDLTTVTGIIIF